MSIFGKLSKFFRRAPAPESAPAERPAETPAPAAHPASQAVPPSTNGHTAAPTNGNNGQKSIRDLFLEELRAIPTRPSATDIARDELLNELKRLSGTDKGGKSS